MREKGEEIHADINMSQIPARADVGGVIFAISAVVIFLVGLPEVRWFAVLVVPLGLVVAVVLHFTARDR